MFLLNVIVNMFLFHIPFKKLNFILNFLIIVLKISILQYLIKITIFCNNVYMYIYSHIHVERVEKETEVKREKDRETETDRERTPWRGNKGLTL